MKRSWSFGAASAESDNKFALERTELELDVRRLSVAIVEVRRG